VLMLGPSHLSGLAFTLKIVALIPRLRCNEQSENTIAHAKRCTVEKSLSWAYRPHELKQLSVRYVVDVCKEQTPHVASMICALVCRSVGRVLSD
jgi:hypothetical protein